MSTASSKHGISDADLRELQRVLLPYREKIRQIGIFGSRATGAYRENSDVDVVLFGSIDQRDLNRLRTEFAESRLSLAVDLVLYERADPALRAHIDRVMQPLSFAP